MYIRIDWEVFAVNTGIICRKFAGIVVFFYRRGSVYLLWGKFAADEPEDDEENHDKKDELLLPPPVPPKLKKLNATLKAFIKVFEIDVFKTTRIVSLSNFEKVSKS